MFEMKLDKEYNTDSGSEDLVILFQISNLERNVSKSEHYDVLKYETMNLKY